MEEILAIIAGFIFFILAIVLVFYIFMALGLMKMADRLGHKGTWMAWIPFCNSYLLGKVAISKAIGWVLVGLTLLAGTSMSDSAEGSVKISLLPEPLRSIVAIALFVLTVVCLNKIYKKFSTKSTVMTVFTVLSLGILSPIFVFAIRNNPINE
jgi:hypothetical protein